MTPTELQKRKRAAVIGLDPSGQAASRLLREAGAAVTAFALPHDESAQGQAALGNPADLSAESFDIAVHSASISRHSPLLQIITSRGIPLISDLELAFQKFYALSIAISGTNGKTTTAELVEQLLRQTGRKTQRAGGSAIPVCDAAGPSRELDFLTLEINSFQLESIDHFRPAVAVLLNIQPDHLDQYDKVSAYAQALGRLFQNQQAFDWAIVQSEALAHLRSLDVQIPSKLITFSAHNRRADIYLDRGLIISRLDNWAGPVLDTDDCKLRGPHNAENMMAALAVGRVLRLPLEEMIPALKNYQAGAHRLEFIAEAGGVTFINNSKAMNVAALQQSLEALPVSPGAEPNVWLIAGGKDKALNYHDLGPILAQRVKGAFLLGEAKQKLRAAWSLFTPCTLVDSLLEAVSKAAETAVPGDVVLLSPACSSLDMFRSYQHRGEVFRQAVEGLAQHSTRPAPLSANHSQPSAKGTETDFSKVSAQSSRMNEI